MSCGNTCNKKVVEPHKPEVHECCTNNSNSNSAFVIIVVLYILLAIIIGSYIL